MKNKTMKPLNAQKKMEIPVRPQKRVRQLDVRDYKEEKAITARGPGWLPLPRGIRSIGFEMH